MVLNLKEQIHKTYGNRIRIRACGCLIQNGKLLMLKHEGIGKKGYFWNVPGGEPNGLESLIQCVEREFIEETGLFVKVGNLISVNEFIEKPLHAVEYYFETKFVSGAAKLGHDPEEVPILVELKWFDKSEFLKLDKETKPNFPLKHLYLD